MAATGAVQAIDALFAPFDRSDTPGMVVAIAREGQVLYRRGFGLASVEHAVANTPATRMRIGSTTKHFLALLALLLAEDGKLDLDASIRTYLPELVGPAGDPTVRQLLQHRGGSRCHIDLGFLLRGMNVSPAGSALALQAAQKGRNFAPGEAMIYNNSGYHLVSIAIERCGNDTLEAQLKNRLFDPLAMYDTALVRSDYIITPGIATMHMPREAGGWSRGLFPSEELLGEGGIVSTVDDMLRWAEHLRLRNRFGSPQTWAQLTQCQAFPDGTPGTYALGLMIGTRRGVPIVHHAGGVPGGASQMLTAPDHALDVVILSNGAPGANPWKLAEKVLDLVLAEKLLPPDPVIPAADYRHLLGNWWSPASGMMYSLIDDEGALKLSGFGLPLDLERAADGRAVSPGLSVGDIAVQLDDATDSALDIAFGGESAAYRRVAQDDASFDAFARACVGQYHCPDCNATAFIEQIGNALVLRVSDFYGGVDFDVACMGETVALATSANSLKWSCALTFSKEGPLMTSFRVNSLRTRNLVFERAKVGLS